MTRQQQWAHAAWKHVRAMKSKGDEGGAAKYRTLCMKTPALIQQSGLVQALAFLSGREKDGGKKMLDHLGETYAGCSGEKLMEHAQQADALSEYMALTRDLTALAIWYRRFAQSELKGEETDE